MGWVSEVTADSPGAWYRMGEASGSVIDTQGGSSGTVAGTVVRDVAGFAGADDDGAIDFDGSTGRITVPSGAGNNPADTFTVEALIRPDVVSAYGTIAAKGTAAASWAIQINASGKLELWDPTSAVIATSTATLVAGSTYHVAVTKSGATTIWYVNGVAGTTAGTNTTITTNALDLYIGALPPTPVEFFNGIIDELAIYPSVALSPTRVTAHYDAASGGAPISQGPRYPGTAATLAEASTSENAEAWVSPGNISADDGTASSITAATYDTPDISQLLVASDFTFTIPTDATIVGIVVEVDRNNAAGAASDNRVQLAKGTTFASLVGSNKADTATDWPAALAAVSYGTGTTDLWGTTWTPAEINATSFAVMLSVQADAANTDVAVDYIRVTVHYTAAAVAEAVPRRTPYPQLLAH